MELANYYIGTNLDENLSLEILNGRIHVLAPGYWFVKKFVDFQFGPLSPQSPLHKGVLKLIEKHTMSLPYPYPSLRVQEKEKEDVKVLEREKVEGRERDVPVSKIKEWFEKIWSAYPPERRHGKPAAFKRFSKTVHSVEDARNCAGALENYLKKCEDHKYLLRASRWFEEWEDHSDDSRRSS